LEGPVAENFSIDVHYVTDRAHEFATHGVYGGLTAQGQMAVSFFSERSAIPRRATVTGEVSEAYQVLSQQEVVVEGKQGTVRTINATHYMSVDAAESIAMWLLQKVAEARAKGL
jgi:hypothetical protein